MATYDELLLASENEALNKKIRVACIVAAEKVRTESTSTTNHAARVVWAKRVFENPYQESTRMIWAVLAQNKAATFAQIIGATDAIVQVAVDAALDVFT